MLGFHVAPLHRHKSFLRNDERVRVSLRDTVFWMQRAVDAIEPTRLQTYTSHALNKTVFDFMSSDGFNDSNTAKVLILLTDGEYVDSAVGYV